MINLNWTWKIKNTQGLLFIEACINIGFGYAVQLSVPSVMGKAEGP